MFELQIAENDVRARQFSCHLIIYNGTQNSVDLLAINYRLGSGVSVEKNEDASSFDIKEEYDELKADIQVLLRSLYLVLLGGAGALVGFWIGFKMST
jgi:hypothetical protein